jgi:ankyrin repeat protein
MESRWQKVKQLLCNRSTPDELETALRDLEPGEIDSCDVDGNTLLHWVCIRGDRISVKLILDYGASVHVKNKVGKTPLHACVYNSEPSDDAAELLLDRGADLEALCDRG